MKYSVQVENEWDITGARKQYDIFTNHHAEPKRLGKAHTHTYYETIYILEGELICKVGDHKRLLLHKGDIIFIPPNIVHATYTIHPIMMRSIVVKFSPLFLYPMETTPSDVASLLIAPEFKQDYYVFDNGSSLSEKLETIMRKCLEEQTNKKPDFELALRGHLIALYIALTRNCDKIVPTVPAKSHQNVDPDAAQQLHQALIYLKGNYKNNISMQEVADICAMNYYQFSRFFKKMTNKNFNNYLLEMRLNYAQKKLLQENKSILEVSLECGFENLSYFIRKFKNKTGVTPKKFQQKYCISMIEDTEKDTDHPDDPANPPEASI